MHSTQAIQEPIMTLCLYSTLRAWRRDIRAEKASAGGRAASPIYEALSLLGIGLAGIACGSDIGPSGRR